MTDDRLHWDINKLNNLFDPPTIQAILKIHLSTSHSQDKIIWAPNKSGIFSVKSAYLQAQLPNLLNTGPLLRKDWKHLWRLKIHERLKLLLWKIAWDILPTRFFLSKKWDIEESSCPFCSSQPETSEHLFFGCPFAVITWSLSPWPLNPTNMNDQPIHE
jgi:hypothetical protein